MRKILVLALAGAAFAPALSAPAPAAASTSKICLAFIDGLGCINPACDAYGTVQDHVPAVRKLPPLYCTE